jgi:hypothetical protein
MLSTNDSLLSLMLEYLNVYDLPNQQDNTQ